MLQAYRHECNKQMYDQNWHTSVFCIPVYRLQQEYNGVTLCGRDVMYGFT